MKLTLIRHGITQGNKDRLYYGATDLPLLPEGEEELRRLANKGGYPTAQHYYTSGMLRTEQTFALLYGERPHEVLPGMREINFGDFEMRNYEQLKDDPAFVQWCTGDVEGNVCPNGESSRQMLARAWLALQPVLDGAEDAVCVTHGGVIANLLGEWFPCKGNRYTRTPHPGTGYTVEFDGRTPVRFVAIPQQEK